MMFFDQGDAEDEYLEGFYSAFESDTFPGAWGVKWTVASAPESTGAISYEPLNKETAERIAEELNKDDHRTFEEIALVLDLGDCEWIEEG